MEYTNFITFVQNEIKQGSHFRDENGRLIFDLPSGDTVLYEWKNRQVIRKVKAEGESTFQGRTVLAYHVYFIAFVPYSDGVMIDIGLQNWYSSLDLSTTIMARGRSAYVE